MCVSPKTISVTHKDGRKSIETVPCGKCHECAKKKQNDFAILTLEESRNYLHMLHVTLTYNFNNLPIQLNYKAYEFSTGEEVASWSKPCPYCLLNKLRDRERYAYDHKLVPDRTLPNYPFDKSDFCPQFSRIHDFRGDFDMEDYYHGFIGIRVSYMPSLCRDDVRLAIKRFRLRYARKFGFYPKFSYAHFGEYGHKNGRPHTHLMVFGFTLNQFQLFLQDWKDKKGFWQCTREIPIFNENGTDGRWLVALYVAKYVSKAITEQYKFENDHEVERPRRVTTKGYGFSDNFENIKAHYLGYESFGLWDPKSENLNYPEGDLIQHKILKPIFEQILDLIIKRGYLVDGKEYSLPKKYKYEILYTKDNGDYIPTALQRARSIFIRDKFSEDDKRIREEFRAKYPQGNYVEETNYVNSRIMADRQAGEDRAKNSYIREMNKRKIF